MRKKQYSDGGKVVKFYPYDDEGDETMLLLTDRQRQILLVLAEMVAWKTRWGYLPSDINTQELITDYADETRDRLMRVLEFCAEMIKCMDEDEDVQNRLTQFINNIVNNGTNNIPGEEMSNEEFQREIADGSNPSCNTVILSRQCSYVVRFFDKGIVDFLERLVVSVNTIELAQQIAALPFINLITKQVGIDSAASFIVYMASAVKEQYEAGKDDEYLDGLAKKLYCLCRLDCKVTLDRYFQMTAENINELIPKSITEGLYRLVDILEILTGLDTVGTDTVDLMFWLTGVLAKVVSFVSFKLADRALDFGLRSAGSDESFDLDIEGLECVEPEYAVPMIRLEDGCFGDDWGGENIENLGDGMWEITATLAQPSLFDYRVTIKDVDSRMFYLADVTFPDGYFSGCIVGNFEDGGCFINGCDAVTFRYGENITEYVWTFTAPAKVRFRMSLP